MGGRGSWLGVVRVGLLAVEVAGGLVACVASAVLWREVSAPARERALEVAGTLAALE